MHQKGEHWRLKDSREVIVVWDLPNNWIRILNDRGKLEVIKESELDCKIDPSKINAPS